MNVSGVTAKHSIELYKTIVTTAASNTYSFFALHTAAHIGTGNLGSYTYILD